MTSFRGILSVILCLAIFLSPVRVFCDETSNSENTEPVNYYKLGWDAARQEYRYVKSFGTGFALGLLLPVISMPFGGLSGFSYTIVSTPIFGGTTAYFMSVKIPEKHVLSLRDNQREQFTVGYTEIVRTKRTCGYIVGNIIGSVTLLAIIIGSIDWSSFGTT
jgi:hypothetical protein